jgi:phosphoenolpyruvate carboxylase
LTAYIAGDSAYRDFWNMLLDEYRLSKDMVLLISGYRELMEEEPVSKKSIEIRERIVLPLLVIQQYALQKIEKKIRRSTALRKIVRGHCTAISTPAETPHSLCLSFFADF